MLAGLTSMDFDTKSFFNPIKYSIPFWEKKDVEKIVPEKY